MSDTEKYPEELPEPVVLVFICCGAAVIAREPVSVPGIAFAFGLSRTMIHIVGIR